MFPKIKEISLKANVKTSAPLRFSWKEAETKTAVFGIESEGKSPTNAVWMGKIEETNPSSSFYNYNLWLATEFPSIIMIYGRRGTGKSYTMGVLAEGLISTSLDVSISSPSYAVLLIDTLGQFWQIAYPPPESEKEQISELTKWDLKPQGFSNIQVFVPRGCSIYSDDWKVFSLAISDLDLDDWCGLLQVDRYSDRMGQLMSQAYEKVLNDGYVHAERDPESGDIISETQINPNTDYTIDDLLDCIDHDREINSKSQGFEKQTIRALRSRLSDMRTWKVFSDEGTPIKDIFKKGVLTIINLGEADYGLKTLITGILTKKIFKARAEGRAKEEMNRVSNKKIRVDNLPPGWILLDEAHNYCPENEIASSKEWLIRYAKEGRSLGLGLVGTTQQPSALSSKLTSQINILICHSLAFSHDIAAVEARVLNNMLDEIIIDNEEIKSNLLSRVLRNLDRGEALISSTGVNRVFLSRIRPRLAAHGGTPPQIA